MMDRHVDDSNGLKAKPSRGGEGGGGGGREGIRGTAVPMTCPVGPVTQIFGTHWRSFVVPTIFNIGPPPLPLFVASDTGDV